ncbi:MAG: DUF1573 domain-containing protein [Bacteroidia bacterium]|nr:DUF1573 domain-containing protein [Bacteroidia bacterium]
MKKSTVILCLLSMFAVSGFAQEARKITKEMRMTMKQLPLESRKKLLESAKRELTLQEAVNKSGVVAGATEKAPATAPKIITTSPSVTVTPETKVAPVAGNETKVQAPATSSFTPPAPPAVAPEDFVTKAKSYPATTLAWDSETFDFGKMNEGDKVKHIFTVTNTGTNPLYVVNVKPSCGCTSPNWTKEAIAPGKTGIVEIEFNSAGKAGMQSKTVMITTNTEPVQKSLKFTGEVLPKPGHDNHDGHNHDGHNH